MKVPTKVASPKLVFIFGWHQLLQWNWPILILLCNLWQANETLWKAVCFLKALRAEYIHRCYFQQDHVFGSKTGQQTDHRVWYLLIPFSTQSCQTEDELVFFDHLVIILFLFQPCEPHRQETGPFRTVQTCHEQSHFFCQFLLGLKDYPSGQIRSQSHH